MPLTHILQDLITKITIQGKPTLDNLTLELHK